MTVSSLYERLGATDGIRAIVDDILAAHLVNPVVQRRFLPLLDDEAHKEVVLSHLCHFLEAGSGGVADYTGKSMPDAHRGMNISGEEYLSAVDDIMGALDKNGIDEGTKLEVLGICYALKGEIMHL